MLSTEMLQFCLKGDPALLRTASEVQLRSKRDCSLSLLICLPISLVFFSCAIFEGGALTLAKCSEGGGSFSSPAALSARGRSCFLQAMLLQGLLCSPVCFSSLCWQPLGLGHMEMSCICQQWKCSSYPWDSSTGQLNPSEGRARCQ